MKKFALLVAVFMSVSVASAFAAVENIKVSGDITTYGIVRSDFPLGSNQPEGTFMSSTSRNDVSDDSVSVMASVARLRFDADLTEDIMATIVVNDERVWGLASDDIYASEAYVTVKNFLNSPLTFKVGKQPVRLHEGILLGDFDGPSNFAASTGTAFDKGMIYDLSPRKNPEGIVAEYDFSEFAPLKLTAGFLKISEGVNTDGTQSWINAGKDDDSSVYFADLSYLYENTPVASVFYVGRNTQDPKYVNYIYPAYAQRADDVHNYGARAVVSPVKDLIFLLTGIYQYQKQDNMTPGDVDETAWLASACMQYTFSKLPWTPVLSFDFSVASDKWDIMYEDCSSASIANALVADTNGIVAGATLALRPMEDLGLKLRYMNARLYKANTIVYNNYAYYALTTNREIGNEVDVSATYDYTEDVQIGIEGGVFVPGHAFDKSNRESAKQAIGSLKVSF